MPTALVGKCECPDSMTRGWSSEWWNNSSSASKCKRCDLNPGLSNSQSAVWVGSGWALPQKEQAVANYIWDCFVSDLKSMFFPSCFPASQSEISFSNMFGGVPSGETTSTARFKFHVDFKSIWLKGLALAQPLSYKKGSLAHPKSSVNISCAWVELMTVELWPKHVFVISTPSSAPPELKN